MLKTRVEIPRKERLFAVDLVVASPHQLVLVFAVRNAEDILAAGIGGLRD
jgi:hypothetical protein